MEEVGTLDPGEALTFSVVVVVERDMYPVTSIAARFTSPLAVSIFSAREIRFSSAFTRGNLSRAQTAVLAEIAADASLVKTYPKGRIVPGFQDARQAEEPVQSARHRRDCSNASAARVQVKAP